MKKQILAIFAGAFLLVGLAACGSNDAAEQDGNRSSAVDGSESDSYSKSDISGSGGTGSGGTEDESTQDESAQSEDREKVRYIYGETAIPDIPCGDGGFEGKADLEWESEDRVKLQQALDSMVFETHTFGDYTVSLVGDSVRTDEANFPGSIYVQNLRVEVEKNGAMIEEDGRYSGTVRYEAQFFSEYRLFADKLGNYLDVYDLDCPVVAMRYYFDDDSERAVKTAVEFAVLQDDELLYGFVGVFEEALGVMLNPGGDGTKPGTLLALNSADNGVCRVGIFSSDEFKVVDGRTLLDEEAGIRYIFDFSDPLPFELYTVVKEPMLTADYELLYEGIDLFDVFHYAAFKCMNIHADLYKRQLQDDTGEYIELSLWSDQKEVWYTVNSDDLSSVDASSDYDLFYWKHSERLTLDRKLCYYVVPIDGTVYLMRYSVENRADAVTMSYKVFGISPLTPYFPEGEEAPLDVGSITVYLAANGVVDPDVSFPVEQLTAFADTVKGYMENGYLAASTLGGVYEFGCSADRDNSVFPYLYDIFPWMPELAVKCGVNTEGVRSAKQMLTALQKALPTDTSVAMPDVTADGACFITGDYYGESDENYLTIHREEDGSYGGHLLIANLLQMDFAGHYDNGILTAVQTDGGDSDAPPYEMEISFQKGKATVTITAVAYEDGFVEVGEALTVDRNEKPESLEVMKHAEPHRVE
ncbi:MAG: hypothetical protein NC123_06335 [Butyrivibrio sp.]|nr:hypothetical protein [Acetatifactor muris]MCM1559145.1 hypothetical protein [Butyrivibrio sp.]